MTRRMMKSPSSLLSFFCSLALLSGMSLPRVTSAEIRCREAEREALLELKQRLHDPSNRLSSWVGEDCCAWQGVGCSNITGNVIKLDLRNDMQSIYYISFVIPYLEWEMLKLQGDINTPSLLSLEQLTHLDLSGNGFNGPIPAFLGSFARLTYLDLSNASFSGKVPDELGNLSTLRHLDLSGNYNYEDLSSSLYVENPRWIARLTSIRYLDMSDVSFRRTSGWFQALNALPHIQDLELAYCDLIGPLPHSLRHLNFSSLRTLNLQGNDINGTEPTWVYNITTLENLFFGWNDIYWSSIHGSIARLASLKTLDLAGSKISNSFLVSLSNLCKLEILRLIEITIKDEPSNLEKLFSGCLMYSLEELDLYNNQLNGSLPNWLGNLKNIKGIDLYNSSWNLYNSSLHGSILNSLGSLTSLQGLDLSYNNLNETYNSLHGSILNSLGNLTSLQFLDLSNNNLNGTIGESIGQLNNLIYLDLSHNSLSLSIIQFANLLSLKYLHISNNFLFVNETDDWIPTFKLQTLDMSSCKIESRLNFPKWLQSQKNLTELHLENARIEGTFPSFLPPSLQVLYISNNSFFGHLPLNIRNILPNIYFVDLSLNNFNGSIPHSLCQMHNLMLLQLSKNNFSGELPNCWNSSSPVIKFDFSNNLFHGEIPHTFCHLQRIQSLSLRNNSLSGRIPLCLQDCRNLIIFDAGYNNFTESIPTWSKKSLTFLRGLSLDSNSLTGNIPELSHLAYLQTLDLSNNDLSGTIPKSFGNFNALKSSLKDIENVYSQIFVAELWLKDIENVYSQIFVAELWLRIKGIEYDYKGLHGLVKSIDLSNNNLSGYIPKELGKLHRLQHLNLSKNNLIGEIPWSINGMQYLEGLDLSRNNLSGTIPSTLAYLNFLGKLNLSYNNLSGSIPIGTQLQSFDPSTYIGNPYLCGPPLTKGCTSDIVKGIPEIENKDGDGKKETIWLFASIALGFIMGFWGIWSTLLLHKRWRLFYFCVIDNAFDKLYMKTLLKIRRKFS